MSTHRETGTCAHGRRPRGGGLACVLAALGVLSAACTEELGTGTARVGYTLTSPAGDALTCELAGVDRVTIELYAEVGDPLATHTGTAACEVDDDGEGQATADFPTGFYERSVVTLLDATGEAAVQHTGAPARWEYLSVEIAGGVPTDYLPPVPGVFEADAQ